MEERVEVESPKKAKALDHAIGLISCLLILLPAVFSLLYVHAFGVSVVFSDAWSMVPLFDKLSSGTLQLSDLFNQHNEHRMFFPGGVELLLGSITRYDSVTEMYLIQVCYLATTGVLLLAFRGALRGYVVGSSWLLLFVPLSFLIFSFRQYENILFGYQINFALAQLFSVLALFMLCALGHGRFRKLAFAAALGSATIAAFSVLQGLFTWPVGLLQLLIGPLEKRQKRIFAVLWGLAGLVEWVVYFIDYRKPRSSPSLLYVPEHPVEGILFFLRDVGEFVVLGARLRLHRRSIARRSRPGKPLLDLQGRKVGRVFVLGVPPPLLPPRTGDYHAGTLRARARASPDPTVHGLLRPGGGERLRDAGENNARKTVERR